MPRKSTKKKESTIRATPKRASQKEDPKNLDVPTLPVKAEVELEALETTDDGQTEPVESLGDERDDRREKYFGSVGRRKEAVATIRLFTKKSNDQISEEVALLKVNGKDYQEYFTDMNLRAVVESPLRKLKSLNRFKATVMVHGGGLAGQADAIKHGLSRALTLFDVNFRKKLKKGGFLTRDPRAKERRKYGLKKARKSPQWQKR